jgi:hypothetical protein
MEKDEKDISGGSGKASAVHLQSSQPDRKRAEGVRRAPNIHEPAPTPGQEGP